MKTEDTSEIKTTLTKFLDRTSLPAVPVIRKTSSPWRKCLWFCFIIVGFSMAFYQSYQLVIEYRKYLTVVEIIEKMDSDIPFPSITFCPNSPLLWEKMKNMSHPIYHDFIEALFPAKDWDQLLPMNRFIPYYKESILTGMFKMNQSERSLYLKKRSDYILYAILPSPYQTLTPDDFFLDTYIPYYGICSTFNPGLPQYKSIFLHSNDIIEFYLYDDDKNKPPPFKGTGILISLHSPQTSPQPENGNSFQFTGSQEVFSTLERAVVNRLPSPYPSNCVNSNDESRMKQNPFFSQDRPYLYTSLACMDKLHQDRTLIKKCTLSKLSLPNDTRPVKMCPDDYPNDRIADLTDCPVPCQEQIYDWTPYVAYSEFNDSFITSAASNLLGKPEEELIKGLIRVKFRMGSGHYTVSSEKAKYTISDILGSIGGNFGLWIGLSIVSIFEVFDFVTLLVFKVFKCSSCKDA